MRTRQARKLKKTKNYLPTIKELDRLWAEAIKLRAGMKSGYKDIGDGHLHSHHIIGKPTLSLRYNLDNGVCITGGQHFFVAHVQGRAENFKQWALKKRGTTEKKLLLTKYNRIDKFALKLYLEGKIKEFKQERKMR